MTGEQMEQVAEVYLRSYGEHLVAHPDWVEPIYETVVDSVVTDPDETHAAFEIEVATRTAAVIAVITHGVAALRVA